ncbi:LOW QUALITY PROTEIN: vicilin Jug r 6.0101 [Castanea sativa]|uniref:LOW QUALITY PROTEIN: vicilin Jug r 6.0101 n=1 Tax=Castanea sativa TaxID=21020 RepID=UPI003F6529D3
MASKAKVSLALLLLSLLVLCASLAQAKDPELKICQNQCKRQKQQCERNCDEYIREKKERERQRGEGNGGVERESYDREEEREEQEEEEEEEEAEDNPFLFEDEDFESRVETDEGSVQVLQRFTKRSKLLRGIENYRVAILEADPLTFISPAHFDAELVLFVAKGRATITMVRDEERMSIVCDEDRKSFNLECGDVIRVPMGTPFYMINRDENEKLYVVKILQTISIPGHFEAFNGPGGEDPESFYTAFSREVLQATLKADGFQLDKLFHKQRKGSIMKASKEKIDALRQHKQGSAGIWPFGSFSSAHIYNLFNKQPSKSNQYGSLYEALPNDYKQLQDVDLSVAFANITRDSMVGPIYYSKATKISVIVEGEGYFEMACPHLSSSRSRGQRGGRESSRPRKSSTRYRKVSGALRPGVVFVTPASHPFVVIASRNSDLKVVCFEINAKGNIRYNLAGKGNVMNKLEKEAKELAFNLPAREVESIFNLQDGDLFFQGPKEREEEYGRAFE